MTSTVRIVSLFLQETGTFDRQYSRPYSAQMDNNSLQNLSDRIEDVSRANPAAKITGTLLAGLGTGLIVPSAAWEKELNIANGWNERRCRFLMEVEVVSSRGTGTEIYFFQGYTDYYGVSLQGSIDPNMTFFINSFIRLNRGRDYSNQASAGYVDIVTESAQVIDGRIYSEGRQDVFGLRPQDLFVGVQSTHLQSHLVGSEYNQLIDSRLSYTNDSFRSNRNNAIPSNYLGKMVESYRTASALADFGNGTDDIYDRAIQTSHEARLYENRFLKLLSDQRSVRAATYFTLNDLVDIDPTVIQRTSYAPVEQSARLAYSGEGESWAKPTLETQLATIVNNAVSGLMVENMLVSVGFRSTNLTVNSQNDTRIMGGQSVTTDDRSTRKFLMNFVTRFESEVMPDLTDCGMVGIDVTVEADLYNETRIWLSIEGAPPLLFVVPSFCDAVMAPVVTTSANSYHGLVNGLETIVQNCSATQPSIGLFGGIRSDI